MVEVLVRRTLGMELENGKTDDQKSFSLKNCDDVASVGKEREREEKSAPNV